MYSGDTCTINDFLPFVPECNEFYVDCSVNYGGVHLKWAAAGYVLKEIRKHTNCNVYIMHIDDREAFLKMNLEDVKLVTATD